LTKENNYLILLTNLLFQEDLTIFITQITSRREQMGIKEPSATFVRPGFHQKRHPQSKKSTGFER